MVVLQLSNSLNLVISVQTGRVSVYDFYRALRWELVTQGPYAYTRNPMTLGAFLLYVGIGVWIGSGAVLAASLPAAALILNRGFLSTVGAFCQALRVKQNDALLLHLE